MTDFLTVWKMFQTVWKLFGQPARFLDSLENFQTVRKIPEYNDKFSDRIEHFRKVELSRNLGRFSDNLGSMFLKYINPKRNATEIEMNLELLVW